jgi:hypothetical protein
MSRWKEDINLEKIICNNCKSVYELDYIRLPMRDSDSILCDVCEEVLFSWRKESRHYEAKLIEKHEEHLK